MSQEATDGTGWRDSRRRNKTIFINMIDSSLSTQVAKTLSRFFAGITGGVLELSREVVLQLLAGSCSQTWGRAWKCWRQSRIFIQILVIKNILIFFEVELLIEFKGLPWMGGDWSQWPMGLPSSPISELFKGLSVSIFGVNFWKGGSRREKTSRGSSSFSSIICRLGCAVWQRTCPGLSRSTAAGSGRCVRSHYLNRYLVKWIAQRYFQLCKNAVPIVRGCMRLC